MQLIFASDDAKRFIIWVQKLCVSISLGNVGSHPGNQLFQNASSEVHQGVGVLHKAKRAWWTGVFQIMQQYFWDVRTLSPAVKFAEGACSRCWINQVFPFSESLFSTLHLSSPHEQGGSTNHLEQEIHPSFPLKEISWQAALLEQD